MVVKCESDGMSNNRKIFDMLALKARQKRSKILGPVDFVDEVAINQVLERLSDIKKTFKNPAIIGGKASLWAKKLGLNNALLIKDGNCLSMPLCL